MGPATIVALTTLLFMSFTESWKQLQELRKTRKNKLREKEAVEELDDVLSTSGEAIQSKYDKVFRKVGAVFAKAIGREQLQHQHMTLQGVVTQILQAALADWHSSISIKIGKLLATTTAVQQNSVDALHNQ